MIKVLPDKYKIPEEYRRKVLAGYFAIILVFLGLDLIPLFYGYLNVNWQILLAIITLIPGAILGFYFFIAFIGIIIDLIKNPHLINDKPILRTHYLLIWGLDIIWIVLNHIIYNSLNLSGLDGLVIPIISILLIIKYMK